MAEVVLHPDPISAFPPGVTVKIYKRPVGAPASWAPSGAALSESTVSSAGALKVEGLEENALYVATAVVGGVLKTLQFVFVPAATSGSGISKAEAEALIAEKAVSTASPAFTGTPTAPTAAEADNSTKLATTKYADRAVSAEATARVGAVTAEAGRAEAAEAAKLTKASNLSDLVNAGTARTNLGLGTAAVQATGAFDAAGVAATAQAAAEARLPTVQYRIVYIPPGTAVPNEELGAWDIKLRAGEKRKLLWARYKLASGTINLAIKRGSEGATEIAAYKKLEATNAIQTTSSEQEFSDGDVLTVTGSGGATPKGIRVTIAELVTAP